METHTILKDWPIKPGVTIPKGTNVQLQAPYIAQLQKAKFLAVADGEKQQKRPTSNSQEKEFNKAAKAAKK